MQLIHEEALAERRTPVGAAFALPRHGRPPAEAEEPFMATKQRSTVVGVFNTRAQAQLAVDNLRLAGFSDKQIAMVMHRDAGPEATDLDAAKAAQVSGES